MQCYEILLPVWVNGVEVSVYKHQEWDEYVYGLAGGLTIVGTQKGQWYHQGKLHRERMISVKIVTDGDTMRKIAKFSAKFYDQKSILYWEVGSAVYVVSDRYE